MSGLRGVVVYEARMQLRRPALWLVVVVLLALEVLSAGEKFPTNLPAGTPPGQVMGDWALTINLLAPVGIGVLLADRLIRDRRLQVEDLLTSLPVTGGTRLWGKYCGTLIASLIPVTLVLLGAAGYEARTRGSITFLGWALVALVAVIVPGVAFVGAFALIVPAVISAPLFRVLFVGYWFWGNLVNPDLLPTLTGTVLTPIGDYAAAGLFGTEPLWAAVPGLGQGLRPHLSASAGLISIAALLGVAALVLLTAQALLARRAHH